MKLKCPVCKSDLRSSSDIFCCNVCGSKLIYNSNNKIECVYSTLQKYKIISYILIIIGFIVGYLILSELFFLNENVDNKFRYSLLCFEVSILIFIKLLFSLYLGLISIRSGIEPIIYKNKAPDIFTSWVIIYLVLIIIFFSYGIYLY